MKKNTTISRHNQPSPVSMVFRVSDGSRAPRTTANKGLMAENAGVMENELHRAAQADGHWSKGWVQEEVGYAEV